MEMLMNKKIKIIIPVIIVCIAILAIYHYFSTRIHFNDSYVNGNTSGNLYNAGLFCESNGEIFFSNQADNGKLYSMDTCKGHLKKLCDDTAMYINADKNYVYYVRSNNRSISSDTFFSFDKNSLCRISRDGGKATVLDPDPCIYASLVGNYIYYLHYDSQSSTCLYKIKIDGTGQKKLMDHYVFTCNASGQYFYYNNPSTGQLYQYDTATDSASLFYDCNCYKPVVIDSSNVYYMDVSQNNAIVHVNINSPNPVTLTEGKIEHFNVYGSYIFYQQGGDNPALCVIKNDGSGYKELAKGEYSSINVTSSAVYFTDYFTQKVFYTSTANPGDIKALSTY